MACVMLQPERIMGRTMDESLLDPTALIRAINLGQHIYSNTDTFLVRSLALRSRRIDEAFLEIIFAAIKARKVGISTFRATLLLSQKTRSMEFAGNRGY